MVEAYCMKCKEKHTVKDPKTVEKNGRWRIVGECKKCGGKVSVTTANPKKKGGEEEKEPVDLSETISGGGKRKTSAKKKKGGAKSRSKSRKSRKSGKAKH